MRNAYLLLAVVLAVALAPVVPASASGAGCTPDVVVAYHYQGAVIVRILNGCGHEYAAWGDWVKADGTSDIDTGTFAASGFVHVCDDPSNCVSHPDGHLVKGGWVQERHCAFGCVSVASSLQRRPT